MRVIKRIKPPGWIVLFLLVVLLGIGVNKIVEKFETVGIVVANSEVWSKYSGINLNTETKEAKTYTSSISKPTTKGEKINKGIHEWLQHQENDFLNSLQEYEEILNEQYRAHLNILLQTEKVSEDVYNLMFTSYSFSGGTNGLNRIKSFTINLGEDKIYKLDDIMLVEDEDFQVELQKLVEKQIQRNITLSNYVDQNLLNKALKSLDELDWSINKEAFTIYFDEYEIAAGAIGAIEIHIPIEELASFIDETIIEDLNIAIEEEPQSTEELKETPEEPKETPTEEQQYDEEVVLDPNGKYIALTFDDGPCSKVTPKILKTLKEFDAKATFFMLGSQVDYYPALAKQVADNGHEIANHTQNHKDLTTLHPSAIRHEIATSRQKIIEATGQVPQLFRPPYGAYNESVLQINRENQESMILWSVDSLDWKSRNATAVNEKILNSIRPGSIVLLHDIHPSTADALPMLLSALKEEGYEFITVSQLLSLQNSRGVGPHSGN